MLIDSCKIYPYISIIIYFEYQKNVVMNQNESMLSLDEIEEVLECVICLEFPKTAPIYQCDNGHVLCNSCHGRVTDCPTCRGRLGKVRNLAIEKIIAKFPIPCKFNKYGCEVILAKMKLSGHEIICRFKPASCPVSNCSTIFSGLEIMEHLNKAHVCRDAYYYEGTARITNITDMALDAQSCSQIINNSNQDFLFCWHITQDDAMGFCWKSLGGLNISVYQLNSNCANTNHTFSLSIRNEDCGEELGYSGKCLTLDMNLNHVASIGRCLNLNNEVVKRFSKDNCLYIKYFIHDSSKQSKSNLFPIIFSIYLFMLFLYNFWL